MRFLSSKVAFFTLSELRILRIDPGLASIGYGIIGSDTEVVVRLKSFLALHYCHSPKSSATTLELFGTSFMATMQSWTEFEPYHYFRITTSQCLPSSITLT